MEEKDIERCNQLIKVEHANWIGISNQLAIKNVLNELNRLKKENEELKRVQEVYKNLRKNFNIMIDKILGKNYYNLGCDTYMCDKFTCEDIINKKVKIIFKDKNSVPKEKIEGKLEKLSSLEHKRWANWQKYVHDLCIKNKDGSLTIPKDRVQYWNWEIETEYKDLPEYLKEYDRQEIRIFLQELLEEEN